MPETHQVHLGGDGGNTLNDNHGVEFGFVALTVYARCQLAIAFRSPPIPIFIARERNIESRVGDSVMRYFGVQ